MLKVHPRSRRGGKTLRSAIFSGVVLLIAAAGLGSVRVAAQAAPASLPEDRPASLTISTYDTSGVPGPVPNDGTQADPGAFSALAGVNGVTVQIQRITNIDLLTSPGWLMANSLSGVFDPADTTGWGWSGFDTDPSTAAIEPPSLGAPATAVTSGASGRADGTAGIASFTGLQVGLYLVQETATPAGVLPAPAFVVTLPMTTASGEQWNYDVHVYPKSGVAGIHMTASDRLVHQVGDVVTWQILSDIVGEPTVRTASYGAVPIAALGSAQSSVQTAAWAPARPAAPAAALQSYRIADALDPRLEYSPAAAPLQASIVDAHGAAVAGASLSPGVDFTLAGPIANQDLPAQYPNLTPKVDLPVGTAPAYDPYNTVDESTSTWLVIEFTPQGIGTLADYANLGDQVKFELPTVVKATAAGVIPNQAALYLSDASWNSDAGVLSETPVTKFGDYTFMKADSQSGDPLAGARFQVYPAEAVDANGKLRSGHAPLTINGVSEWVSDSSGLFTITGLRYSDYFDNIDYGTAARPDPLPAGWNTYYLVEVKAPTMADGNAHDYVRSTSPIAFEVNASTSTLDLTHYQPDTTVKNVQAAPNSGSGSGKLAFTGVAGLVWLIGGGGLLVGAGLALLVPAHRRRNRMRAAATPE